MSISTRTGDDGTTALASGERVQKSDQRIDFVGTLDELNAHIGLLRGKGADKISPYLEIIQNDLFELGSGQTPPVEPLEAELEKLEAELPPLQNFILPGGLELAAEAHLARAVCRRAERLSPSPSPYLNRLSDYLFLVARKCNIASQRQEQIWRKSD